jgi:chromate transporter
LFTMIARQWLRSLPYSFFMRPPSLTTLGKIFLRYGNLTFGGGTATIATLDGEIIDRRRLLGREHATLSFALARLTPGTNLLAYCAGVGWLMRGIPGSVVTLIASSLPCSVIAVCATVLYEWALHKPILAIALHGAAAAAVGVMFATGWTIVRPFWKATHILRIACFCSASCALALLGVAPLTILLGALFVGLLLPVSRRVQ